MKSSPLIPVGENTPRTNGGFLAWLGVQLLRLLGWRVTGQLPDVPKAVLIMAPHTSNWDGVLGLAAIQGLKVRVNVLGKDSLFVGPLGWLLRHLGVIPVNRTSHQGMVEDIAARFRREEKLYLAIAPEGTRHAAEYWKTGFYQIAQAAQVPIVLVAFNYQCNEAQILSSLMPTGDMQADLEEIYRRYRGIPAKNPAKLSQPLRM